MVLEEYKKKRKFEKTTEPKAIPKNSKLPIFVIQKHAASHLHYDFRMAHKNVLKSWAVPKGVPQKKGEKRLAVMVEDHPIDYQDFEGIIPEGNYGAGTVMIWDKGHYKVLAEKNGIEKGLKDGVLHFELSGKKVSGVFSLVKMEGKNWLFIKTENSDKASKIDLDKSEKSGRSMEEIKSGVDMSKARKIKMMHNIKPMLATLVDKAFTKQDWIFEVKWDGYRAVAEIENKKVKLYSRNGNSFKDLFLPIYKSLEKINYSAIFDGEVVILDKNGRSDFELLHDYIKNKKGELVYYVFDILYYDGLDLRKLPLVERRQILKNVLPNMPNIKFSDDIKEDGKGFATAAKKKNLEGIMAKDGLSLYKEGQRTMDWQKIKFVHEQEVIIVGYTKPEGSRGYFGSLVLAVEKNKELIYVGKVGSGFNEDSLKSLHKTFQKLIIKESPLKNFPLKETGITWLRPELVCEVKFQEWTKDGSMRVPIFLGLRQDKKATQVIRELPYKKLDLKKEEIGQSIEINNKKIPVTNLDKVFWPELRLTKNDLIEYYKKIANYIIPYLKDRPESLLRHPDGIKGEAFFQKNMEDKEIPSWIKTKMIESENKRTNYLICQNKETLIFMANFGCIEINPWSSTIHNLEKPDFMIFDLDPEKISFDAVIEVALKIKGTLDEVGIKCYPKTSGVRGIHILVPLGSKYTYKQCESFAELIAIIVSKKLPKIVSLERSPAKRQKKVYIDYLQNGRGKTIVAPYSLRATTLATVSTPLDWKEVKKGLKPTDFTIKNIFSRLQRKGDIFKAVLEGKIDMETSLKKLSPFR